MAPKNPKSARGKNNPPLIKHRAKRLEVYQQIMKAAADLNRRMVQLEKKIDWKSEAEAFRKLFHHTYSIQKESGGKELGVAEALRKLSHHMYCIHIQKESEGKIEKRREELEAVRNITSSFNSFSIHPMYSIEKESERKIEKRLEEMEAVRNITSSFNSFSIHSSQKRTVIILDIYPEYYK
ncbi:hypothetical protein K1719_042583 [Acacia pycnantha]|nr:hypothetical protein K1719_042583 [Acacia pycnantha]